MPLTQVSPGLLDSNAQYYGFKNRLINGGFAVAQRGTSFSSLGSGAVAYGLDRWFGFRGAYAANLDVSQQAGFSGLPYCMRLQRTSGTSGTQALVTGQVIESINMYDLAGQTITFSAFIRAGANYSGSGVNMDIFSSTSANQSSAGVAAGSWPGLVTVASQTKTITSTGTLFTVTATIPANALSLAVEIYYYPTGTAGANDYIEITGVQLEKGSTATSFDYRDYGRELAMCQRYYQKLGDGITNYQAIGSGTATGVSTFDVFIPFLNTVRASPTITASGMGIARAGSYYTATLSNVYPGLTSALVQGTSSMGATSGQAVVFLQPGNPAGLVTISAEL